MQRNQRSSRLWHDIAMTDGFLPEHTEPSRYLQLAPEASLIHNSRCARRFSIMWNSSWSYKQEPDSCVIAHSNRVYPTFMTIVVCRSQVYLESRLLHRTEDSMALWFTTGELKSCSFSSSATPSLKAQARVVAASLEIARFSVCPSDKQPRTGHRYVQQ